MTAQPEHRRPGRDEYFMGIALAVRTRADCTGNRVGAVMDIQPVTALRSFSTSNARRRLFSKSVVVSGGFWKESSSR